MTPAEFRAARERLGLTQTALAAALEVTLRAVQMWEAGDRAIPGPARVALRLMSAQSSTSGGRRRALSL
jgi:DNA-binding transcriptional regulator YiaG